MSPLVQRPRPASTDQHWSMLLFESLSAGVLAITVGLGGVMLVVGVYAVIVWPLTFYDLANLGLDQYDQWASTVLWSVFAGGTLAGYWCFSGAAFKEKAKRKPAAPVRPARSRR